MKKISETLPDIYNMIYRERYRILNALYQKNIKFPDVEKIFEEWETAVIMNSYYTHELNKNMESKIMHLKRKNDSTITTKGRSTIHSCINFIRQTSKKNMNRHIDKLNIIRDVFLKEFAEDAVISWSPNTGKTGTLVNRIGDVFITYDYGVNWSKLDLSYFYTKYRSVDRIQTLVFNDNVIFLKIVESNTFHIFSIETTDDHLDHYFIADTDRLGLFSSFIVEDCAFDSSNMVLKVMDANIQNYQLLLEIYCKKEGEEPKLRLFSLDLYVRDNSLIEYSRMGKWAEIEGFYDMIPPNLNNFFVNQYRIGAGAHPEIYQTELMQYFISDNVMYLATQNTLGTPVNINRSYDLKGIDYGEISNDNGSTQTMRWIKTTKGYFFITSSMQLIFIPGVKTFISFNDSKGFLLMSDGIMYSYYNGFIDKISSLTDSYQDLIRGSFLGEGIYKNNLNGYQRIILNRSYQITLHKYYHPMKNLPTVYDRAIIRFTMPWALDYKGTILSYEGTTTLFSINGNKKRVQGIQCSKDGGGTWSMMYELSEDPIALWYMDQKWVLIDHCGIVYWGDSPDQLFNNTGARLGYKGVNEILELRKRYINQFHIFYQYFMQHGKITIYPVSRSFKDVEIVKDLPENPSCIYKTTLIELFTDGAEISTSQLNNFINDQIWTNDGEHVYYSASDHRINVEKDDKSISSTICNSIEKIQLYKNRWLKISDTIDIENVEYLKNEAPVFSYTNELQCIKTSGGIKLKSDGKSEYSAIFDNQSKIHCIRSSSDKDIVIQTNTCDIVLDTSAVNRQHSALLSQIDPYCGKKRHFYGRIHDLESKVEYFSEYKIEYVSQLEEFIFILLTDGTRFKVGTIHDNKIFILDEYFSGWNIENYRKNGYENVFLSEYFIYYIGIDHTLWRRSILFGSDNAESIATIGKEGHLAEAGGFLLHISNQASNNIMVYKKDGFSILNNVVPIDDICEWNGKIWFVCNINYDGIIQPYLSYQTNMYSLFNEESYIMNQPVYIPMISEGYYGLTENEESNKILSRPDKSLHMIITACNDYILIWSQYSNAIYRYDGKSMSVWKEIEKNIKYVGYGKGIVYLLDMDDTVYYSYDGVRFSIYPWNTEKLAFDKIFNIEGTLLLPTENTLLCNDPIVNNRFGYNQGYNIRRTMGNTINSTHEQIAEYTHEELNQWNYDYITAMYGNDPFVSPESNISGSSIYITEDRIAGGRITGAFDMHTSYYN